MRLTSRTSDKQDHVATMIAAVAEGDDDAVRAQALAAADRRIVRQFRDASDDYLRNIDRTIDAVDDLAQRLRAHRAATLALRFDRGLIATAALAEGDHA